MTLIHKSLPQTKTPEQLAVWIQDQKKDLIVHTDKFPLTDEEIRNLEHASAQASAALYRLKEVEDLFKEIIKGGTLTAINETTGEPEYQPAQIIIPPTKGTKALEANRKYADDQLKEGFRYEDTNIYMIPWPEESKMVGVDIEGKEWSQYTRFMTNAELNANKPLLREEKPLGVIDADWMKQLDNEPKIATGKVYQGKSDKKVTKMLETDLGNEDDGGIFQGGPEMEGPFI